MSPVTKKSDAKKNGWAQTRDALVSFKGLCLSAEFGQWGTQIDERTGLPKPAKEYLEVKSTQNVVLAITEELSMDITAEMNFRVNCSDFEGSFWIEKFVDHAEKLGVLLPDGLQGKVITWTKVVQEAFTKKGERQPQYDYTGYVPVAVEEALASIVPPPAVPAMMPVPAPVAIPVPQAAPEAAPVVVATQAVPAAPAVAPAVVPAVPPRPAAPAAPAVAVPTQPVDDPLALVLSLAVGRTDADFKAACKVHPQLMNSPLQALIQAGAVTNTFLKDGRLSITAGGVYSLPA